MQAGLAGNVLRLERPPPLAADCHPPWAG